MDTLFTIGHSTHTIDRFMEEFKKKKGDWSVYKTRFKALLSERRPEEGISKEILDHGCLLCSEDKPENCHRKLVAEYFREKWENMEIVHIT